MGAREGFAGSLLVLKWKRLHARTRKRTIDEGVSQVTATKESETSVLQSHGTESCQHLTEQGHGLSYRATERDTALLTPWFSSREIFAGFLPTGL